MRPSPFLALALISIALRLHAQDHRPSGARIAALSGASSALVSETWASQANPASLAACRSSSAAAFVVPALFGLSELRTVGAAAAYPVSGAVLGGSLYRFGFDLYHETGLSLACGLEPADGLAVGGSVHLRLVGIARYGQRTAWSADLGAVAEVTGGVWIGAGVRSLWGAAILLPGQDLPTTVSAAVAASPRENTLVIAELEREEGFGPSVKCGIECDVVRALTVRGGWATNPETISAGVAVRVGLLEFAYAGSLHGELGWTHAVELQVRGGQ